MVAKPSAVPSNIATLEQTIIWSIMCGNECFPNQFYPERAGVSSWAVEASISKSPDGRRFFVGRCVLPLSVDSALTSSQKPWLAGLEVPGGLVIPSYYTSN